MTTSVLWTLLPLGYDSTGGQLTFSLVASPRSATTAAIAADSQVAKWPSFVNGLSDSLAVVISKPSGPDEIVKATITTDPADQVLWDTLVPRTSVKVEPFGSTGTTPIFVDTGSSFSYRPAVDFVSSLFGDVATDPAAARVGGGKVARIVDGMLAWMNDPDAASGNSAQRGRATVDASIASAARAVRAPAIAELLAPSNLTAAGIEAAAKQLRDQGHDAAAEVAPLIPILNRLRVASAKENRTGSRRAAIDQGPLAKIPAIDSAEFHQLIGLLLDHPTLAVLLGLRIDLRIPAFEGNRVVRIGDLSGAPINGPVPIPQPWSAVVADSGARRFTMATQPDAAEVEVKSGVLDMRGAAGRYLVTDVDPVGVAAQLEVLTGTASISDAPAADALPTRREAGIVVAQVDRVTTSFKHAMTRNARFDTGVGPAETKGAPLLFADDVTGGYRIDVATDDGPFRSLMRRKVTYTVDAIPVKGQPARVIEATDEGALEPFSAVQQEDGDGTSHLFVGEELFSWNDWSLAAQPPGPTVGAETAGAANVVVPDRKPFPTIPLLIDVAPEPGTLSRMRYGKRYRFRARAVDIAGNSLALRDNDDSMATDTFTYRRHEPVAAPDLVLRHPCEPGESLDRLVVLSDGNGTPIGGSTERHLVAPKASQMLCQRHGHFDEALNGRSDQATRDRLFALARREEGTLLDPTVIGKNGASVPAEGIAVATNIGAPPAQTTLPVPRGEGLRGGEYIVHDTDQLRLPYLPDPASAGVAVKGLPGRTEPLIVPWGNRNFPEAEPRRLVLTGAPTSGASVSAANSLEVTLAPATEIRVQISSTLTQEGLTVMDKVHPKRIQSALAGQVPQLSPSRTVTLVHAVQRPVEAATLEFNSPSTLGLDQGRPRGGTTQRLTGKISAHAVSTSKVDIEGTWTETIDRGFGPVVTATRTSTAGSVDVDRDRDANRAPIAFDVQHELGDSRRHRITYRPVATTSFREYFIGKEHGNRSLVREGEPVVVDVPSTRRPEKPRIHSVLPLFRHEKSIVNGVLRSTVSTAGVRVVLQRPWFTTGEDERLGVLVAENQDHGQIYSESDRLRDLVSRWGVDPYEGTSPVIAPHFEPKMIGGPDSSTGPNAKIVGLSVSPKGVTGLPVPGPLGTTGLAVVGVPVTYDKDRELWFADIEIDQLATTLGKHRFPMVRLALVRFQPHARMPFFIDERCSGIVHTDFIPIPPSRTMTAKLLAPNRIEVSVEGSFAGGSRLRAKWQTPAVGPISGGAKSDIGVDSVTTGLLPPAGNAGGGILRRGVLVGPQPGDPALTLHQSGRVVVVESLLTRVLTKAQSGDRFTYVDTFDVSELAP